MQRIVRVSTGRMIGFDRLLKQSDVPIIPIAVNGMQAKDHRTGIKYVVGVEITARR